MLCGLPASGKSTYAKKLAEVHNANIHSSDEIREELSGDINNQNINDLVFRTLHSRIKEDLKNGKSCIYDATNINYKRRMGFLNELNNIPCEKICYLVATPYEECLKNNANRDRKVPEEVIERMYRNIDVPYWYEGWDRVEAIYLNYDYLKYYGVSSDFYRDTMNFNQNNSYHTSTLGNHCKEVFYAMAEETLELQIAGLLHDCGKLFTKTFTNSKGEVTEQAHYYNHERVGSYNSLFYNKYCGIDCLEIATLIRWHMQPYFWERNNNEKLHNKYRKLWREALYRDIMLLHEADKQAH
jgi:predicted kinase